MNGSNRVFHIGAMWNYLDSDTALLARKLGAVPKFPPERPMRAMLPVPKKLAFSTMRETEEETDKKRKSAECAVCSCKRRKWIDALTDLDKLILGVE